MECIKINNKNNIYEKSNNILIPKRSSFDNINKLDECILTFNNFDPNKISPPNNWNHRLYKRINNYTNQIRENNQNHDIHQTHQNHDIHQTHQNHDIHQTDQTHQIH